MAGSPTIGTVFALAGAGRLRASADKTVLGLGVGPTTVGLEWDQNALRFAWMTQPIPTFGPIVTDSVAVAGQSACNRATLRTETCRCKSRPPEFHFCMFRCVRARRSMRHPSSVGDCARYSGPWISKSSLYLYSRASRRTMMLRCTVECSDPASAFRRIRPQAPRVGHWARISFSTTQCQATMHRGS